jgi:hypothetical protein
MERITYWHEKLLASIINVSFVLAIFIPLLFLINMEWRLLLVLIFFIYNLLFLLFNNNRCLGMIILKTYWKKDYSFFNYFVFIILYTLSFSTLLFYAYFPFDLFLVNMLLLQLPTIIIKNTTFHGWLSGNIVGVKKYY